MCYIILFSLYVHSSKRSYSAYTKIFHIEQNVVCWMTEIMNNNSLKSDCFNGKNSQHINHKFNDWLIQKTCGKNNQFINIMKNLFN